jgi:purine-binding chemotaxis protein CheW
MSFDNELPTATGETLQLVVCVLGNERYGIEVGRVKEIIRYPTITTLPDTGRAVRGVINLRGRIIPIVDLRERFGLPEAEPTKLSRIVVTDAAGLRVGFIVDAVNEVARIERAAIDPTPELVAGSGAQHVTGICRTDDALIIMLDLDRLVSSDIADATASVSAELAPVG